MKRVAFRVALGAIAAAALALRLTGTEWGKPYAYHFDEPFILKPALRMVDSGDPNPRFFRYPSLMIYLEAAIAGANHGLRGMPLAVPEGPAYGPSDLGTWTWPALAGGRHAVAVVGTAAVVLAGILARYAGGAAAGLLAASLLAVFPLHVEHSHYLTTDVPAATFLLAAFVLLAVVKGERAAAWAGVSAGLAIATKYTAAAALPALVLLCLLSPHAPMHVRLRHVAAMLATCGLAFVLACPYAVLDADTFFAELKIVRDHYTGGHLGAEGLWNWRWYIERLRDEGLGRAGLALLLTGAVGVLYDVARALTRVRTTAGDAAALASAGSRASVPASSSAALAAPLYAFVLLCVALAWFAWLGAVTVRFERNLIPAVVLLCPAAGHGLARLLGAVGERSRVLAALGWLLVAVALSGPAMMSSSITRRLSGQDTRGQALAWMDANVPSGSYIVREEYTPQPDAKRYRVEYLWSLGFGEPRDYRRTGVRYVIASQAVYARFLNDPSTRYPEIIERYKQIFGLPRVALFVPDANATGPLISIYRVPRGSKRRAR